MYFCTETLGSVLVTHLKKAAIELEMVHEIQGLLNRLRIQRFEVFRVER